MSAEDKKTGTGVEVDDGSEDFIRRWARRKAEATAGAGMETPSAVPATVEDDTPDEDEAPSELLTDADMPSIETLEEDSDVSGFLSPGVSDDLRRAALRKLFRSPKFNVCDGLDDYCGDYTKFEPLGDIITADMRFQMERALERLAEAGDGDGESVAAAGEAPDGGAEEPATREAGTADDPSATKTKDEEHDV